MAKINYDFYDNQDIYNDGDVEAKLLDFYRNKKPVDFYEDGVFYLTTDVRSNILNWFPFQNTDEVLEVGCGCGTITGMLCDRCKSVYSIDGSKRRCQITYYRHKNKDNLTVYAGNFEKIKIDKKFDYVILIGVFEYSKIFFEKDNPFDYFLEKIKERLKPNGKVLLAIENRYGLKYWVGCNEDHLKRPYVGLEGYDNTNIQTFGKQEFIRLIQSHGFCNYKFFYPFPDYKLPSIIYSDERLPKRDEICDLPFYYYGGKENFDSHMTMEGLFDNGEFGFFSNSFLVEFGMDDAKLCDTIYARNLSYRNLDYKTITIENQKHEYMKIAENCQGEKHLDDYLSIHKKMLNHHIKACTVEKKNQLYCSQYIEGKSFNEYILGLSKEKKWDLIEEEIDKLVQYYYSISNFRKIGTSSYKGFLKLYQDKTYIMKVSLIDGNASNIIINSDGDYVFIDQEWESDDILPTDYLIYFSLLYLFSCNTRLSNHFSIESFYKKYSINLEKIRIFNEYNHYYFTKKNDVINVKKKEKLDSCLYSCSNKNVYSVVYYDVGNDFNEEDKIVKSYSLCDSQSYSVSFTLPKGVKRVRFDPKMKGNQFMYFDNITINGKKIKYDKCNIVEFQNRDTLVMDYPFIVFPFKGRKLDINIEFSEFTNNDISLFLNQNMEEMKKKEEKINLLNQEKNDLLIQLEDIKKKYNSQFINRIKNFILRKFRCNNGKK